MNLKKKDHLIIGLSVIFIISFSVHNVYAVTVYPGTIIQNPNINYTANVKPNFNVTQIITNSTDIYLGQPYYDLSWIGHKINANITGFNEGINFSALITSPSTSGVTMNVLGKLQQVKLNNANQAYGSIWSYGTCGTNQCTKITVGTATNIFLSWTGGSITTTNFSLSGYVLANNGFFNPPDITLTSPATANVTALLLFNTNGALISYQVFAGEGIVLQENQPTNIPATLQDNTNPSGTQSYYEEAILQSTTSSNVITSNIISLNYGSFTNGNFNFNVTNTNTVPIYFIRKDLNTTDTRLSVIYPGSMNMQCNMNYTFAMTNKTYGPPLANSPYQGLNVNSSFQFHDIQNEIINVLCTDTITHETGKYVLTQNSFPFQQQISDFRNGKYGTHGQFGIFDIVSLGVIILSMIGFNRKNEAVGAFFCISIIGAAAYFQIVTLPTFILAAVIVVGMIAYTTTRKNAENF